MSPKCDFWWTKWVECVSSSKGCKHQQGVSKEWPRPTTTSIYKPNNKQSRHPFVLLLRVHRRPPVIAPEFTSELPTTIFQRCKNYPLTCIRTPMVTTVVHRTVLVSVELESAENKLSRRMIRCVLQCRIGHLWWPPTLNLCSWSSLPLSSIATLSVCTGS